MVDVTKMVPKIVLEQIEEVIPIYKEVEVITQVPVIITDCKTELQSEGKQQIVKNLTYEKIQQTHQKGDEIHGHSGFSKSRDVEYPANPNMHGHVRATDGLAFTVDADKEMPAAPTVVVPECTENCA
jgi:hypothetical protein